MFNLIRCRTFNHCRSFLSQISAKNELYCLQNHPFSSSSSRKKILEPTCKSRGERSFTVKYLMKSCGLSEERAFFASQHVSFETPEKPDSVLAFLKNHGFSDAQVSVVIRKNPRVLISNPEKIFIPKFDFFQSLGFSRSETISLLTKSQNMLVANVESHIIPHFNVLSSLFNTKDETIFCIKRYPDMLSRKFYTKVTQNIQIFKNEGVSEYNIITWLKRQPRSFLNSSDKVKETVEELKKMGFNPQLNHFLTGAYVMMSMNRSLWDEKIECFKTWGVSEDEVRAAFRSNPWCMASSKEQIQKIMDFFVNEVGFKPLDVIKRPVLFSLSLKKTIIPRYSVYQVLLSKGLAKKKQPNLSVFNYAKKYFLEKFVECHLKTVPELLKFKESSLIAFQVEDQLG